VFPLRRLLAVLTIVVVPLALPAHALGAVPGQLVGDSNVESNADSDPAGAPEAFQYAATASGSAHRIHVYLDQSSAATTIVAGLYRDNNGTPGTLLAQGSLATPAAGVELDLAQFGPRSYERDEVLDRVTRGGRNDRVPRSAGSVQPKSAEHRRGRLQQPPVELAGGNSVARHVQRFDVCDHHNECVGPARG
jgi:hypothetical protein